MKALDPKFCVDCAHEHVKACYRPRREVSLVTGERLTIYESCSSERTGWPFPLSLLSRRCGPEARYFTPRSSQELINDPLSHP